MIREAYIPLYGNPNVKEEIQMCVVLYLFLLMFTLTTVVEVIEKKVKYYKFANPKLNYRKEWM